jgi:PhnB protein
MSSKTIEPYLFFSGRCEEAIAFYCEALDAELQFLMRYNQSPEPLPPGMVKPGFENKVMHATLKIDGATLMVADDCTGQPRFDGFRLSLALPTEADAQHAFAALSAGGNVQMPLTKTFWSPCFGMITDQFGVGWMITIAETPAA